MASVTEASLRVATCSGALKLGKIKASTVDVDTAGESEALLATLSAHTLRPGVPDACKMQVCLIVGLCLRGEGGGGVGGGGRRQWVQLQDQPGHLPADVLLLLAPFWYQQSYPLVPVSKLLCCALLLGSVLQCDMLAVSLTSIPPTPLFYPNWEPVAEKSASRQLGGLPSKRAKPFLETLTGDTCVTYCPC